MTVADATLQSGLPRRALRMMDPRPWLRRHRFAFTLAGLIGAFLLVLCWEHIVVPIRSGEQGVYWSRFFGGTSDRILTEGSHLKFPWDQIRVYDIRVAERHQTIGMLTRDGMEIGVEWSVRYRPRSDTLPRLHRVVGPRFAEKIVVPEVTSSLRQILGNYTADQIYAADEQTLLKEIAARVRARIESNLIVMDEVLIVRLNLPAQMAKGIIDKLLFEQRLLAYRFRVREAEQERDRKRIEAEGIKAFEQISGISILKWRGIDATVEMAKSPNAKIVVIGTDSNSMPLLLNAEKP